MAAVSRSIAAVYLASVFLRPLQAVTTASAGCPAGATPQAQEDAMTCIDPAVVSGAPVSAGHVMLSDLSKISPTMVTTQLTSTELLVTLPAATTILIGTATCNVNTMAIKRADKTSSTTVQMRLDFTCPAGQNSGFALMDVAKTADKFMDLPSMYPFFEHSLTKRTTTSANGAATNAAATNAAATNGAATNGALAPTVEKTKLEAFEVLLGGNKCAGTVLDSFEKLDKRACKMVCLAHIEKFEGVFNPEQCGGYAVDLKASTGKVCNLYKGLPVQALSAPADTSGWECYNMTTKEVKETVAPGSPGSPVSAVSTPATTAPPSAPPSAVDTAAADAHLPKLALTVDAMSASVLTFTSKNNTCFAPFQAITLEDATSKTASVKIKESEWKDFLKLLPLPGRRLEATAGYVSSVTADRVNYGATTVALPLPQASAPGKAAGAVPSADGAEGKPAKAPCRPMPRESSFSIGVLFLNMILLVLVAACGYGGYKAGGMFAAQQVGAAKGAAAPGYQPLE